ncbi:HEAT repeat-containing protein, partial [Armatimonadetes bacterium GXS]
MEWQGVKIELRVPCAKGKKHPVRLRFTGWGEYEVVHNPCVELLGEALARMAPCSHYLQEHKWWTGDSSLRKRVVDALSQAGSPAVPALIQALGDEDWAVRAAACAALGRIGDPQAVPALIQALGDRDKVVREAACGALVKIGKPAVPALIQALG